MNFMLYKNLEILADVEMFDVYLQGTLIQHLKEHLLHGNRNRQDVILYYSTVIIYLHYLLFIYTNVSVKRFVMR